MRLVSDVMMCALGLSASEASVDKRGSAVLVLKSESSRGPTPIIGCVFAVSSIVVSSFKGSVA